MRQPPFVELPGTATVLTLGAHMCKWPIGDPSTDDFTFCGRRAGEDGPYCIDHARRRLPAAAEQEEVDGGGADAVPAPLHLTSR